MPFKKEKCQKSYDIPDSHASFPTESREEEEKKKA
jgi:hypothetical protein